MASTVLYPFTFPISGIKCEWRPLKVQEKIDELSSSTGISDAALGSKLLRRRVVRWGDADGGPTPKDWGELDELDVEEFAEEVREKEAARVSALRKTRGGADPMAMVKKAVADVNDACGALGRAVGALLEAAEAARAASIPLT